MLQVNWDRTKSDQEAVWRQLMSYKVKFVIYSRNVSSAKYWRYPVTWSNTTWGTQVAMVGALVQLGYDVFVTDVDTALLQSPFQYLPTNHQCDLSFQADHKVYLL